MVEASVVYRSIIRLTETRNIESVNAVFIEIVSSIVEGRFALYVLQGVGRENRFVLSTEVNPFGDCAENVLALFNPSQGVEPMLSRELRPFPLASINGLHAVLIVDRKAKVIDEVFLNFLISVYCNQFNLVETCSYDALTGLMNRGEFDKKLYQLLGSKHVTQRSVDQEDSLACLALLDIDHFKLINDKFGHLYGDEVLLLIGQLLQDQFRQEDWLFRYGGEEFAIILKNVSQAQCVMIFERVRAKIEAYVFPQVGQVTISIGYSFVSDFDTSGGLIAKADEALYFSKTSGRNQVYCYQSLLRDGDVKTKSEVTGDIDLF